MVFYNNALAVPILLPLCAANGELGRLWRGGEAAALSNPAFLGAAGASAALAFGISFTSLWFLSTTTATAFSLVGSLNKVPIALLGLFAFGAPATPQNIASIGVGLAASAVFVLAKQGPPSAAAKAAGANGGGV
jgi:GDP-mannose transporter